MYVGSPMVYQSFDRTVPHLLEPLDFTLCPCLKGHFLFFNLFTNHKKMETVGIEPTSETISNSSHPQAWEIFLNQQNFSDLTVTRDRFLFDFYN